MQAIRDAGELRYLDGGGVGCFNEDERPTDRRALSPFDVLRLRALLRRRPASPRSIIICSAREAPYPWWDLPVVLGTLGGIGLFVGPIGLLAEKCEARSRAGGREALGMDVAFIVMLFLTSLTGLALLVLRETPAMGLLLALHLGVVFSLFITMPYGKFVHGLYRFVALVRYAMERKAMAHGTAE